MKGYVRENTQQITAGYSALRKCRNAVSAGVLSPISSAVGRNGAVGDKRNACAGGALPRRQVGVAPAGAGWGVSCSGTSNFLLLSKESYQRKPLRPTVKGSLGAGRASANLAVLASRNWRSGGRCRFGGSLVPLAPLPLTAVRVGVGALIEWRLSNRAHCGAKHRNG